MKSFANTLAVAASIASVSGFAVAGQLAVTSYDTPNGDGQASGGSYNYWDGTYTGSGAKTTDGAALSGGVGALTDGVVASQPWYNVSNDAGTGPYVGWLHGTTPDPTVTFHFASSVNVNEIQIQMDNTGVGGVDAPSQILIDGVATPFTAPGTIGVCGYHRAQSSRRHSHGAVRPERRELDLHQRSRLLRGRRCAGTRELGSDDRRDGHGGRDDAPAGGAGGLTSFLS